MTNPVDRRVFLTMGAVLSAGAVLPAVGQTGSGQEHVKQMSKIPENAPKVGMLIYPKMVALDLIGPMTIFHIARFNIHLVWKDKAPVSNDIGIPLLASHTFDECPQDLDVLFVPGGSLGTVACMNDPEVLGFLADRGERAKWVTSVCTGSLVLAAAGLLKGYDATAYWPVADLLPLMGARHLDERVVIDRNRMTGGGVTAGIDFGLALVAEMVNEELARRIQLIIEYAPAPPFKNGTPAEAGPERTAAQIERRKWMDAEARAAAERAGKRLGIA